jgi:hypothetical protein
MVLLDLLEVIQSLDNLGKGQNFISHTYASLPIAELMATKGRILSNSPTPWSLNLHLVTCSNAPQNRLHSAWMKLQRFCREVSFRSPSKLLGMNFLCSWKYNTNLFQNDHPLFVALQIGSVPTCNQSSQSILSSLSVYALVWWLWCWPCVSASKTLVMPQSSMSASGSCRQGHSGRIWDLQKGRRKKISHTS